MLIEEIITTNLGTEEDPHNVYLVTLLIEQECPNFVKLFKEHQINFAWPYVDMLGLDPNLFMHHLILILGSKLVKKKLRKMNRQIEFLV